jgi:membrane protein DedA with SNARE-associated domain
MEALTNTILSWISDPQWGLPAIFILMTLSSMAVPIPSEIVLLFSGYLAFQGEMNMAVVITVSALGNLTGSIIAYYIGLKGGRPLFLKYGKYVWIKERELDRAHQWFERFGHEAVFFGRMVPVIRAFISVPAGIAEMNFGKFTIYTILGVLPWSIGLGYAGFFLGSRWHDITKYFSGASLIIAVLLMLAVAVFVFSHLHIKKRRKKRRSSK